MPPLAIYNTRVSEHVTLDMENLLLVEKAETIPLHFTLELEGPQDQGSLND